MVNVRWNIYNMVTIWLMVGIMFVAIGFGKSLLSSSGAVQGNAS